jgi:hypothetical protein
MEQESYGKEGVKPNENLKLLLPPGLGTPFDRVAQASRLKEDGCETDVLG